MYVIFKSSLINKSLEVKAMLKKIKQLAFDTIVRFFPSKMGYKVVPKGEGYLDAKNVIAMANEKGLSIGDFLEQTDHAGIGKRRDFIIDNLLQAGVFSRACPRMLEIGAGTGMFTEQVLEKCSVGKVEIYEIHRHWKNYLQTTYGGKTTLVLHDADGYSLKQTADESIDLLFAHGVFVYLPAIVTGQYLKDAARVCKSGGLIVFDYFSDTTFTLKEILRFREVNPYYEFPVVTSDQVIEEFCEMFGFMRISSFDTPYHKTKSTYCVLKKN